MRKLGFVLNKLVTDELRSYGTVAGDLGIANAINVIDGTTIERRIRINRPEDENARCKGSRAWDPRKDFSACMQQTKYLHRRGVMWSLRRVLDVPGVTKPNQAPADVRAGEFEGAAILVH